jgi:hypothetical protein
VWRAMIDFGVATGSGRFWAGGLFEGEGEGFGSLAGAPDRAQ